MTSQETREGCAPTPPASRNRSTLNPASIDLDAIEADLDAHLSTAQTAKRLGVTPATVSRWMTSGVRGADERVHVLPSVRIGARIYTHRADLAGFLASLNAR